MGFDAFDDSGFGAFIDSGFGARAPDVTVEANTGIEIIVNGTNVEIYTHGDGRDLFDSSTEARLLDRLFDHVTATFSSSTFSSDSTYTPEATGWPVVDTPIGYTRTRYGHANVKEANDYFSCVIRGSGGGATVKDFSPIARADTAAGHKQYAIGWYSWILESSSYSNTGSVPSCATGDNEDVTEFYVGLGGKSDSGYTGVEGANPFNRGTLAVGNPFQFSIVPAGNGSKRLDFDNGSPILKDELCAQKMCPGIKGLLGGDFWGGCDFVATRIDSNVEVDDTINFDVSYRSDTDETANWPTTASPPFHLVQFRDLDGNIL